MQVGNAPVAQWTERLTSDQMVVSSNLAGGASFLYRAIVGFAHH